MLNKDIKIYIPEIDAKIMYSNVLHNYNLCNVYIIKNNDRSSLNYLCSLLINFENEEVLDITLDQNHTFIIEIKYIKNLIISNKIKNSDQLTVILLNITRKQKLNYLLNLSYK